MTDIPSHQASNEDGFYRGASARKEMFDIEVCGASVNTTDNIFSI
jgi:hypothetical protein